MIHFKTSVSILFFRKPLEKWLFKNYFAKNKGICFLLTLYLGCYVQVSWQREYSDMIPALGKLTLYWIEQGIGQMITQSEVRRLPQRRSPEWNMWAYQGISQAQGSRSPLLIKRYLRASTRISKRKHKDKQLNGWVMIPKEWNSTCKVPKIRKKHDSIWGTERRLTWLKLSEMERKWEPG